MPTSQSNGKKKKSRLQTTQSKNGGADTAITNCCANCVETSRPQQWGPDLPFLGKSAMRTRRMFSADVVVHLSAHVHFNLGLSPRDS